MMEPLPKFFSILSIAAFRADSLSDPPAAASFFSFAMGLLLINVWGYASSERIWRA